MIRKEIKQDGTFGGNYPEEINYAALPEKFVLVSEEQRDYIDKNIDKLIYDEAQDGIFPDTKGIVDISSTQEYQAKIIQIEKGIKMAELQSKIDALDLKRVRAIAEPQLKDPQSGQTWLEYYTQQIQGFRAEISSL